MLRGVLVHEKRAQHQNPFSAQLGPVIERELESVGGTKEELK